MRFAARIVEKRTTVDTTTLVLGPNPESARVADGDDVALPELLVISAAGDEWRYANPGEAFYVEIAFDYLAKPIERAPTAPSDDGPGF